MRAILATQGLESPLHPLSEAPATASIAGTPLLEVWIRKLVRAGFDEIVIAVGPSCEAIEAVFGDGRRFGVGIAYAFQGRVVDGVLEPFQLSPEQTAGRIHAQSGFCSGTTLLMRPAGVANVDLSQMLERHRASGAARTVANFDGAASGFGLQLSLFEPELAAHSPVEWAQAPAADYAAGPAWRLEAPGDYLDLCMAALREDVDDWAEPGLEIAPGVRAGVNVSVDLNQVEIVGPVYLGGGSVIRPGARIVGPAWVGDCAVVDTGVTLSRSVVGRYSRLGAGLTLDESIINGDRVVDRSGQVTVAEPVGPVWSVEERREAQRAETADASMTLELRRLAGRASDLWSSPLRRLT